MTVFQQNPSPDARAARLAKFEREQAIVDNLNCGVSIAEIAARIGVGEKRMRAIVQDILDRRRPASTDAFAALQFSRLNEAMGYAYSAMANGNLRAIDQVVRIARLLGRYHDGDAAARRASEPTLAGPPVAAEAAFGTALVCAATVCGQAATVSGEPAAAVVLPGRDREDGGARPEIPLQEAENIEFTPGLCAARGERPASPSASPEAVPPGAPASGAVACESASTIAADDRRDPGEHAAPGTHDGLAPRVPWRAVDRAGRSGRTTPQRLAIHGVELGVGTAGFATASLATAGSASDSALAPDGGRDCAESADSRGVRDWTASQRRPCRQGPPMLATRANSGYSAAR